MANTNVLVVGTRKISHFTRGANLEWGHPEFREADAQFLRRLSRTKSLICADDWDHLAVMVYIPKSRRLPEMGMPAYALARLLGFAKPLILPPLDHENEAAIFAEASQTGTLDGDLYSRLLDRHRSQVPAREKAVKDVSEEEVATLRDWLADNFKVRWHIRN